MRRFLIVVERASGNYSAYSPDLPGCVATGPTPDDTRPRMHAAIDMHIRALQEDHLLVNLQEVNGQCKPYQVRQVLRLVDRYNLKLEAKS